MKGEERFSSYELKSIQSGFKELETDQIEFADADIATDMLKLFWQEDVWYGIFGYYDRLPIRFCRVYHEPDWFIGMSNEFIKAVQNIDRNLQGRILKAISYLSKKPTKTKGNTVKPLTDKLEGLWRYRIGDYRLVYLVETKNKRLVLLSFSGRGGAYK